MGPGFTYTLRSAQTIVVLYEMCQNKIKPLLVTLLLSMSGSLFAQSQLPACQGTVQANWNNCFGSNTFPSGNIYVGEYKDGKRNGQGTLNFTNGDKYVGEWRNGQRNGQGTYNWVSGNKYVGDFKDDKRNGQGTLTFPSGAKYFGEFIDGKYNGRGILTFADGRRQEGIWSDGSFVRSESVPQLTTPNFSVSQNNLPACQGDAPINWNNCFGKYIYSDKSYYVGEWKNGKFSGRGSYIDRFDQVKQEGVWSDGSFIRSEIVEQKTIPNSQSQTSNALDIERKQLEEEKLQLAEERRKLEEEKQKIQKLPNSASAQKSQQSSKERRCTQLGLIPGSEDYKKCIN